MNNEQFYAECAALLGTTHEGKPFPYLHSRRTRWNNRIAGQGRFPGRGVIRVFGDSVHVALHSPPVHFIGTKESVLDLLRAIPFPADA
jgi:hypothetical protein